MSRLLLVVSALSVSLCWAQGPVQRAVVKEPALAAKQSLAPDPDLAGDVSRAPTSKEPAPAMSFQQYADEVELHAGEEVLLQFEIWKFFLIKHPPRVLPWTI